MQLAFLGLGQMGHGIAANLLKAGHQLNVWNRTAERANPLVAQGAVLAPSPRAAAEGAEVAFTMVADDTALTQVLEGPDGLLAGLPEGALHISHSTISVEAAERASRLHAERGQRFVSAPVFGRPAVAEAGQLWIVAAGEADAIDAATPLFDAIGRTVFRIGDTPSAANLVKLAGNFMILATVEAYGEAVALAERGGIARDKLIEVLTGTIFDGTIHKIYGPLIAEERYRPAGFAAPLGLKDMRLAGEAAATLGQQMPLLDLLKAHLAETVATEGEDVDVTALAATIAKKAG
ncbi:MAG: NAD(P)-dependent oxidoreductase [Sphingomonas sp.]|uniref:NAD(P)-dependent oxidoreductase n=1 Tax=Sphingomonas sp. TaxID=28214 RepID=UPI001B18A73F|nr:NAD(P)-dependent oxidoreductase [Sphingomonas sp.]MBO9623005.1 NAD(P)-dependent oxidoreductase [Sphingomonas sp.]